jgi:hypothetical protein
VSYDEDEIFEELDPSERNDYEKSLNHRDRLIEFDRNSA